MHACMYVYTYIHTYIIAHWSLPLMAYQTCMYVCMYVCMYAYMYIMCEYVYLLATSFFESNHRKIRIDRGMTCGMHADIDQPTYTQVCTALPSSCSFDIASHREMPLIVASAVPLSCECMHTCMYACMCICMGNATYCGSCRATVLYKAMKHGNIHPYIHTYIPHK